MSEQPITVLFVCMGNICRSPLAEGVFLHKLRERDVEHRFDVDSAGTGGWHAGDRADARMRKVAAEHGVELPSRARQVTQDDWHRFDHILCMDDVNHEELLAMGAPAASLRLLLSVDPAAQVREVPDPYYGGTDGFELVFTLVDQACDVLLDTLISPTP